MLLLLLLFLLIIIYLIEIFYSKHTFFYVECLFANNFLLLCLQSNFQIMKRKRNREKKSKINSRFDFVR